jgi:precorrin-2 dehydrogenase/sirohydrochlorin ferrochelatase
MAGNANVALVRKRFEARDLDGAFLAFACTDDSRVNERVYAAARRRRILTNVVDSAGLCDFIAPSVVSRGALTIAISTSGASPALARNIREDLEKTYGPRYSDFLDLMEKNREKIVRNVPGARDRKRIFEALTSPRFLARLLKRSRAEGEKFFSEKLKELLSSAKSRHV